MVLHFHRPNSREAGFTMAELIVVIAAIAILAAILTPMVFKAIDDSRISRAQSEVQSIGSAMASLYKDTGKWPYTNTDGPTGAVDRLVGSDNVVTTAGTGAGSGAVNWGSYGTAKHIGDFLYWNNPDDDSDAAGTSANETNEDYATSGGLAWKGPYTSNYDLEDPWGNAYVVNVRYLPGGNYSGAARHKVIVLSAGPDGEWQTPFSDGETEDVAGDDIGHIINVR